MEKQKKIATTLKKSRTSSVNNIHVFFFIFFLICPDVSRLSPLLRINSRIIQKLEKLQEIEKYRTLIEYNFYKTKQISIFSPIIPDHFQICFLKFIYFQQKQCIGKEKEKHIRHIPCRVKETYCVEIFYIVDVRDIFYHSTYQATCHTVSCQIDMHVIVNICHDVSKFQFLYFN